MRQPMYFVIGTLISVFYLFALLVLFWGDIVGFLKPEGSSVEMNALGDFLAGVFSPLAFLWLVLGFLQQGAELSNSVKALQFQAKEMAQSVEQQTRMAEFAAQQLEHEKAIFAEAKRREIAAATPRIVYSGHGIAGRNLAKGDGVVAVDLRLVNTGGLADLVQFGGSGAVTFGSRVSRIWGSTEERKIRLEINAAEPEPINVWVSASGALGTVYRVDYSVVAGLSDGQLISFVHQASKSGRRGEGE